MRARLEPRTRRLALAFVLLAHAGLFVVRPAGPVVTTTVVLVGAAPAGVELAAGLVLARGVGLAHGGALAIPFMTAATLAALPALRRRAETPSGEAA